MESVTEYLRSQGIDDIVNYLTNLARTEGFIKRWFIHANQQPPRSKVIGADLLYAIGP